jgi:hypothetical protein
MTSSPVGYLADTKVYLRRFIRVEPFKKVRAESASAMGSELAISFARLSARREHLP